MAKTMLVNVTHVEESRVAILEDGILSAYEIETQNRSNIVGDIHNVVVDNVMPSLEAAFVKIGPDMKGFLPLDEVNFRLLPPRGESRGKSRIAQHLQHGQRLMAQVVRAPFGGKPPTVSTYFSLPGRYLVLMPGVDSSGISRKIGDTKQRDRLKKVVDELKAPEGFGVIVRTAGAGRTKAELQRDLRYLLRLWESVQRASAQTEFPGHVYEERDLVIRTIRDYLTLDIEEVWIDSEETYERALAFAKDVMPNRAKALKLYQGDRPLFNKFNLEEQIEKIYLRKVPLPSGGEIVIDGTEALTAIDVNSARSAGKGDAEETATKTNIEAAAEIARQFRLRDLGGLVVVDFIDMNLARNRKKVEKAFKDAMKGDRARYDLTSISKLGLVEVARQRLKTEKMRVSYTTCETCEGYGLIRNVESAGLAAFRKLQTRLVRGDFGQVKMTLPPEVALWVLNQKREELARLEVQNRAAIAIEPSAELQRHQCTIETGPRVQGEEPPALVGLDRPSPAVAPDVPEARMEQPAKAPAKPDKPAKAAEAPVEGGRRRRRRKKPAAAEAEAPEPTEETAAKEETAEEGEAPRRRRRRRRRRKTTGGDGDADTPPADADEVVVPSHVVSEQLMPAAVGGEKRRRGRSNSSSRGRGRGRRRA